MRKFTVLLGLILVAALAVASPPLAAGTSTNSPVLDVPVTSALFAPQEVLQRTVGERFVVEQNEFVTPHASRRGPSDLRENGDNALERVADDPLLE